MVIRISNTLFQGDFMSYEYVQKSRTTQKERMVYVMGEQCQICGYHACIEALEFHHINPEDKLFNFDKSQTKSWEDNVKELKKCILLCSNCHREVHAGYHKNKLDSSFNEERANEISTLINNLKTKQIRYCPTCNAIISQKASHCPTCSAKIARKVENRPTREELKNLIRIKSFVEIGKMFKVSDNTIRKWCDNYSLPRTKIDINSYNDELWNNI